MAVNPFTQVVFDIFIIAAIIIILYTCNFYYLAFLSNHRKEKHYTVSMDYSPTVTVQLPIYNEKYVASRLIDAVCAMDYPKEKMRIMVLDDSDDDTVGLLSKLVSEYQQKGFNIEHVRRENRRGYKAGALKHAMKSTTTDYVAIFDADFIPPNWFLKRAVSHFTEDKIGLIQCRWGHVNENYSSMTKVQALSLDFHFLIEQKAKSNSHLFMNFNGTAGIWRRECIEDAGGWNTATLVEDLDLSYRAQMKGWKCVFLPDIVVDAELPVQMNAAKRQQFRWAKGSIQCALKLLSDIIIKRKIAIDTKIQAFIQLTRHIVFPLMLIQFLALPVLLASNMNLYVVSFLPVVTLATYLAMGPGAYLIVIHRMYDKSWKSKAKIMPLLLIFSAGMSVNNTVGVFDAVFGKKNEFLRTPKYGIVKNSDDWKEKAYNLPFTKTTLLEIFFAVYGILGIFIAIFSNNPFFVPIIAIQTVGFIYVSLLSLSHSRFKTNKSGFNPILTREEKLANRIYKLAMFGILSIIVFGAYMSYTGYQQDVYPLDLIRGNLEGITASSDPETLLVHLSAIDANLDKVVDAHPEWQNSNPVWIFPTETTNFARIQGDIAIMTTSVEKIAAVPRDSSAFHTGMLDVKERAESIRLNIMDATPYMYVSISNIAFTTIWIAAIIGIFAILNKKKIQLKSYDLADGA